MVIPDRARDSLMHDGTMMLVGFVAEARIARMAGWNVGVGGGTAAGAAREARRLIEAGATGLISFGLAGGLDPALPAGTLIVADAVIGFGRVWRTDPKLNARLGGSTGHICLSVDRVIATVFEKRRLRQESGAAIADMESGAAAAAADAAGVPFSVLRSICDTAHRPLPPVALAALDPNGRISPARIAASILRAPTQLWALAGLAQDATAARRVLRARLRTLGHADRYATVLKGDIAEADVRGR